MLLVDFAAAQGLVALLRDSGARDDPVLWTASPNPLEFGKERSSGERAAVSSQGGTTKALWSETQSKKSLAVSAEDLRILIGELSIAPGLCVWVISETEWS